MADLKALISAGGDGREIPEFTGGVAPKSLCRVVDKPLISYQLHAMHDVGVRDVFVTFHTEWQVQLLRQSIRLGECPDMNYVFGLHMHGHPSNAFRDENVIKFIGDEDFIWSWGDLYYESELVMKLTSKVGETGASVCCEASDDYTFEPPKGRFYIAYEKDDRGIITSYSMSEYKGQENFGLHAPLYLRGKATKIISDELKSPRVTLRNLLSRLIEEDSLAVVKPDLLINVNSSQDFLSLKKLLSKK